MVAGVDTPGVEAFSCQIETFAPFSDVVLSRVAVKKKSARTPRRDPWSTHRRETRLVLSFLVTSTCFLRISLDPAISNKVGSLGLPFFVTVLVQI